MRWLDALGWCKWPSLLLIASPIAAYPLWLPTAEPAANCGLVGIEGQVFRAFRPAEGGDVVLRPVSDEAGAAVTLRPAEPAGFSAGGMVINGDDTALANLACTHAP